MQTPTVMPLGSYQVPFYEMTILDAGTWRLLCRSAMLAATDEEMRRHGGYQLI